MKGDVKSVGSCKDRCFVPPINLRHPVGSFLMILRIEKELFVANDNSKVEDSCTDSVTLAISAVPTERILRARYTFFLVFVARK